MTPALLLPFNDIHPRFGGPLQFAGPRSTVIGRARIGAGASLGQDCVVRADGDEVHIGTNVWLGERTTVHIVHEILPCHIGADVTVGTNAVVHACTVGNGCVIEEDVTVLDAAMVGDRVLIEAGATVFPRKVLESGHAYAGSPAMPVRALRDGELAERAARLREGRAASASLPSHQWAPRDTVFLAATAQTAGRLDFAQGSSLFFSCLADAGTGSISVGENTNIQDNTTLRAGTGAIVIGRDVTIGHNVMIPAARIGASSLVGIGAVLGPGTVLEDDVLLAAGATTEPGQVLGSGWLWGGRPARPLSRLDEGRRTVMRQTVSTYCGYADTFRRLQRDRA